MNSISQLFKYLIYFNVHQTNKTSSCINRKLGKTKWHASWFGEFWGIGQEDENKSLRELAVFQASLVLIIPQICSAECTWVSWDWCTIEWATYKLLKAQKEFIKQLLVHLDSCDNTSYCISHQMKQMGQLFTREGFFCKSTGLLYSLVKIQTARKPNLNRLSLCFIAYMPQQQ